MDLRRLIAVARAWLPLMVAATLLAGATAFVVSSLQQKVYEGKATLIVGQSLSAANPDYTKLLVAQGLSKTYASIAKTRPILEGVIQKLGLAVSADALSDRIEVDTRQDTSFLVISAKDTDPARAAAIANELGDQLIAASPAIHPIMQNTTARIGARSAAVINEKSERSDDIEGIGWAMPKSSPHSVYHK